MGRRAPAPRHRRRRRYPMVVECRHRQAHNGRAGLFTLGRPPKPRGLIRRLVSSYPPCGSRPGSSCLRRDPGNFRTLRGGFPGIRRRRRSVDIKRGQGDAARIVNRIMFGIFLDVTGREQAEESNELLAGEMSRRVKNLLMIATALTAITSRSATSATEMARDLTHRLTALGRAHDLVRPGPGQNGICGSPWRPPLGRSGTLRRYGSLQRAHSRVRSTYERRRARGDNACAGAARARHQLGQTWRILIPNGHA